MIVSASKMDIIVHFGIGSSNEMDGHAASTLEPIDRELFVKFDVNRSVNCSILKNDNKFMLMATA